jgi:hypothetical protein
MKRITMFIVALMVVASLVVGGCCPGGVCKPTPMDWNAKPPGSDAG